MATLRLLEETGAYYEDYLLSSAGDACKLAENCVYERGHIYAAVIVHGDIYAEYEL